jgi:hypothetical protein
MTANKKQSGKINFSDKSTMHSFPLRFLLAYVF